jgi:hypothetical protein
MDKRNEKKAEDPFFANMSETKLLNFLKIARGMLDDPRQEAVVKNMQKDGSLSAFKKKLDDMMEKLELESVAMTEF